MLLRAESLPNFVWLILVQCLLFCLWGGHCTWPLGLGRLPRSLKVSTAFIGLKVLIYQGSIPRWIVAGCGV